MSQPPPPHVHDKAAVHSQELGVITPALVRFFGLLSHLSPSRLIAPKSRVDMTEAVMRAAGRADAHRQATEDVQARARRMDRYVLLWLVLEMLLLAAGFVVDALVPGPHLPSWFGWIAVPLAALRILDIFQATVNMSLFEHLRYTQRQLGPVTYVASIERMIVLNLVNYFEVLVCFGLIYASRMDWLHGSEALDVGSAYYFSFITQLTIGYGDIAPLSWFKLVAVLQGCTGFVLAIFAISRIVNYLPITRPIGQITHKQDEE